jgi:hypothetical protein
LPGALSTAMMSRRLAALGSPAMTLDGDGLRGCAKLAALGVQHYGDKLALRLRLRPVDEPIPESCRIDVSQIAGCGAWSPRPASAAAVALKQ